jgi:hypothetical protein
MQSNIRKIKGILCRFEDFKFLREFTKNCCFLCLWDGRAKIEDWPVTEDLVPANNNVQLADPRLRIS